MHMTSIPFGTTDWQQIAPTRHSGEAGMALWRTQHFGPAQNAIRARVVEYSPGYESDHWCEKGHILYCLEGELETRLADGRTFTLTPGVSYQVADGAEPHRSKSASGAKLFIVD
jgi:quercetin dioxygenase-like cupin family protein